MPMIGRSVEEMELAYRRNVAMIGTVRPTLRPIPAAPEMPLDAIGDTALKAACEVCGVDMESVVGVGRKASYKSEAAEARRIAVLVSYIVCPGVPTSERARWLGIRMDRLYKAVRLAKAQMLDPVFSRRVGEVVEKLKGRNATNG